MKQQIVSLQKEPVLNIPTKDGYELYQDYHYLYNRDDKTYKIIIKKGFQYDGASVPRVLWSITGLTPDGLMRDGSLVHDIIYVYKGKLLVGNCKFVNVFYGEKEVSLIFTRKEADSLFLQMLKNSGLSWIKRNLAYFAVQGYGWKLWSKPRVQK